MTLPALGAVVETYLRLREPLAAKTQFDASKLLWHSEALRAWLDGSLAIPVTLELDVSLACNDLCPNCVHRFARGNRFLSTEQVGTLLVEASQLGVRGLTLSGGGEPLCHPEVGRILRLIRGVPLAAGLITNGGLIETSELAEDLVSTFEWIRVSLDSGSEGQFRLVRGVEGFEKRLGCLRRLAQAGKAGPVSRCELGVSFLTSSASACDIVSAAKAVRDLGFDYIQFKPMIRWSRAQHHLSSMCDQDGVFEAIEEARCLEGSGFRVLISGKKYEAELLREDVRFSSFHSAWFVAAVGPNVTGARVRPTLYLDCSGKYLQRWVVGEFDVLSDILYSEERRRMIRETSSSKYCVRPEKHAAYNVQLETLRARHLASAMSLEELRKLGRPQAKHPYSL